MFLSILFSNTMADSVGTTQDSPLDPVLDAYPDGQEITVALSPGYQDEKISNSSDSDNPYAHRENAIKRGGVIYAGNCGLCHNGGGIGGKCPQLIRGAWAPDGPNSDRVMFNIISNGRPGTPMGAFKKHLSERQIWEIIAYLRNEAKKYAEKQKNEPEEEVFRR